MMKTLRKTPVREKYLNVKTQRRKGAKTIFFVNEKRNFILFFFEPLCLCAFAFKYFSRTCETMGVDVGGS